MKHDNGNMNLSSSSSSSDDEEYSSNNDEGIKEKFHQKVNDHNFDDDDDEEKDLDDIEWEDGSFEEEEEKEEGEERIEKQYHNKSNYSNIEETNNNSNNSDDIMKSQRRKRKRTTNTTTATRNKQFKKIPLSNHDNEQNRRIKSLLQNIQKTHLLSLLSRCIFHSSIVTMNHNSNDHCHEKKYSKRYYDHTRSEIDSDNQELVLSVAYSLIPMEFIDYSMNEQQKQWHRKHYKNDDPGIFSATATATTTATATATTTTTATATTTTATDNDDYPVVIPSKMVLDKFCSWFFQLVNRSHDTDRFRRRIHGHSRSLSSSNSSSSSSHISKRNKNTNHKSIRQSSKRKKGGSTSTSNNIKNDLGIQEMTQEQSHNTDIAVTIQQRLIKVLEYLSAQNVGDITINPLEKSLLIISMMRSMGWRVRFVNALDPVTDDLTVDHPFFSLGMKDVLNSIMEATTKSVNNKENKENNNGNFMHSEYNVEFPWIEVLTRKSNNNSRQKQTASKQSSSSRWVHVDPHFEVIDQPSLVEYIRGQNYLPQKVSNLRKKGAMKLVSFVIAVEHMYFGIRITDISPRYANKWSKTLRLRGASATEIEKSGGDCSNKWWSKTLKKINKHYSGSTTNQNPIMSPKVTVERKKSGEQILVIHDSLDEHENVEEEKELKSSIMKEAIPTSKIAFRNHPLYVIPSALKSQEVLAPEAKKRMCGMFKGEIVYKRSDVSTALTAKKWLYKNRKVRESELKHPAKTIKARKKSPQRGFQPLQNYGGEADETQQDLLIASIANGDFETIDDGMQRLYGIWQTDPWSPQYIGPNDDIKVNEYKNVELALINPGLIHLDLHRISLVAKKLGIPYAPCLLGFEGHGGNRTPTIKGIVVHEHNVDILREAHTEYESQIVEDVYKKKQDEIIRRWKRLVNGILTSDRLKREYEKA